MAGFHAVEVADVTRRFGEVLALDRVSLSIQQGEFFCLLGPSGCGKTTLLRVIAGLDLPDSGSIRIGGVDADGIPAHRRPVNTVFQSYALFPHLNVLENVAFGLRMKRVPEPEIVSRVGKVMELVEIEELGRRKPAELSGGQKQRVALARAIVNEPQVLLLDEPLGALDLQLRKQLQLELRALQRRLGITFVCVTHDQEEALVLSDRIAVMRQGAIEQLGDARSLYERPRTRFVSQFLGACSLIEARVKQRQDGVVVTSTAMGDVVVDDVPPGRDTLTLAIRPERVQLLPVSSSPGPNHFRVRIRDAVYAGAETQFALQIGSQLLRAMVDSAEVQGDCFGIGQEAIACLPSRALIVLED